jgi:DnaJ-class molecular chaperone
MEYYQILGINKTATQDEIKQAYRRLASKHHPDKGGSKEQFQKIQEAYATLGDVDKRAQYDNPQPQMSGFNFNAGFNAFDDIFAHFARHQQQQQRVYTVTVFVTLEQVASGSIEVIQVNTPAGLKTFNVQVPRAIEDGQNVRFDGLMPDGPLQVCFRIHPHKEFNRRGLNIYSTVDISVFDLILGTTISVNTIDGKTLEVNIPRRTKPGMSLRLNNRGMVATNGNTGDHFVLISAAIPDTISTELIQALEQERSKSQGS